MGIFIFTALGVLGFGAIFLLLGGVGLLMLAYEKTIGAWQRGKIRNDEIEEWKQKVAKKQKLWDSLSDEVKEMWVYRGWGPENYFGVKPPSYYHPIWPSSDPDL